jgi:NADPH-dependent curcumin reductase CurA
VKVGEVMRGLAVGVVTASKSANFPVGTTATGNVGWTEVAVAKEKELEKVEVPRNGKMTDALGVLGKIDEPLSSSITL